MGMPNIVQALSSILRRTVVDKTGLMDLYDVTLQWAPEGGVVPLCLTLAQRLRSLLKLRLIVTAPHSSPLSKNNSALIWNPLRLLLKFSSSTLFSAHQRTEMRYAMKIVSVATALLCFSIAHAQSPRPQFEVASVKAANSCPVSSTSSMSAATPGRVSLCNTLFVIVRWAYLVYDNDLPNLDAEIQGGPPWITSDLYEISAKTDSDRTRQTMLGPML